MRPNRDTSGISRRDLLKASGLTVGGLALGGALAGRARAEITPADEPDSICHRPSGNPANRYTYFEGDENGEGGLDFFSLDTPLEQDEMRITFMGSAIPSYGPAQAYMSIFVEVGWVKDEYLAGAKPPKEAWQAADSLILDYGTGCTANYTARNVHYKRMDKIFINHLHGDHMGDLTTLYCFGPALDRKSPLFVFGPGPSGHRSPRPPRRLYDDGTNAFCKNLRESCRWHTESFAFQQTAYASYEPPTRESWGLPCEPVPVGDDPNNDAYTLVPIELDWRKTGGVAYHNKKTGVKVTHFKVIHCRKGSVGYKVEWTPPGAKKPLSMIYTSDTKPEKLCIEQAINGGEGVDVFIHEMGVPPEIWAMKSLGMNAPPPEPEPAWWADAVRVAKSIQNSSHTTQGAFAYLMSLLEEAKARPRLTVATHFPTTDDNVACALESILAKNPWVEVKKNGGNMVWSYDGMVIRVFPDRPIEQYRAVSNDYKFQATPPYARYDLLPPKYADPTDQLDRSTEILPGEDTFNENGY